jgi:hypothetical protein
MIVRRAAHTLLVLFFLSSAGCGGEEAGAYVAVGLTTDMAVGFDIDHVDRTTKVNGAVTDAVSLSYGEGNLALPDVFLEEALADDAEIEVSLAALRDGEASPVVTRTVKTRAARGRTVLLPVSLDEACSAVSCAGGATCAEGACVDPFIAASALADYDLAWIETAKDACKAPSGPAPEVVIGKGETAYAELAEDEIVPIEPGPQGGHHVWLALRVAGLRQMGSILGVSGHLPALSFDIPVFKSGITLRKAAENHCEVYGVRFQVDRGISVDAVRGQKLDIEVVLEDPNGDGATATKRVVIAP